MQWEGYAPGQEDVRRPTFLQSGIVALCLLALATGWLIAAGHLAFALILCIALPAVLVVAWAGPAAVAGIIVLLTLNGVPGINLASLNVHGSFESLDICAVALILLAAARYFFGTREPADWRAQLLAVWSALFLVVWMIAFVKGLDKGVPALKAALFGRDFLFFALLVPLAKALVKNGRELIRFLTVMGVMTAVYSLGEIAVSLGVLSPHIINARQTLAVGSLTRVYSPMNDLIALGFSCALAYALLNAGKRAALATAMAVICGTAVVLQLTRALYIGLIIGMIFAFIIWVNGRSRQRPALQRRLLWSVVGVTVMIFVVAFILPQVSSNSTIQAVTDRISAGLSDVGSSSKVVAGTNNTVVYRENVSSLMLEVLGPHWALGLGFLHPAVVYFPQLPNGSIRDNDLGLFNGLMTMGVIGTILIYIPVIFILGCMLPTRSREAGRDWLRLGSMIWLISVIVGSLTLVTLFSPNGLILTAVLFGVLLRDAQLRVANSDIQVPVSTEVR